MTEALPPALAQAAATPQARDAMQQITDGAIALQAALADLDIQHPRLGGALRSSWERLAQHAIKEAPQP